MGAWELSPASCFGDGRRRGPVPVEGDPVFKRTRGQAADRGTIEGGPGPRAARGLVRSRPASASVMAAGETRPQLRPALGPRPGPEAEPVEGGPVFKRTRGRRPPGRPELSPPRRIIPRRPAYEVGPPHISCPRLQRYFRRTFQIKAQPCPT